MRETLQHFNYLEFLNQLDEPIKSLAIDLDTKGVPLSQIGNEIAAQPLVGMTTKGSNNWDNNIFQKVLKELANLICKDNDEEVTRALTTEANLSTQVVIAIFSNYVGQKLGFAAALCSPFVVLAVAVVLKAGLNVFCNELAN